MLPQDVYFIDPYIMHQIFTKNIWYLAKLLMVSYVIFYWTPSKIFPQEYTGRGMQKVVFNFIYMVAFIEVVVTFLIFIKVFSLFLFILTLIATKLAFMKWFYKKNIIENLNNLRINLMLWFLDLLDKPNDIKEAGKNYIHSKFIHFQQSIIFYAILKQLLSFSIFFYIIAILIARGLLSYSDPVSDTSQFISWVASLQQNILYANHKTFGADFYGISIMIFFVNIFTNIDQITLFSLYPILLLLALYFSIYYIIKDFSNSKYVALFAIMIHGMIFMSPLSNIFLGKIVSTSSPELVNLYGLKFYIPKLAETITNGHFVGYDAYIRYISGMAYEHSSVFVLLNAYFLIKMAKTHLNRYLILYTLTLMLVFVFHGGGAIVLVIISILIAINAFAFRKVDWALFKKSIALVILATILGNMWMLSMVKYGIPQDFGAAAPILDKLLGTKQNVSNIANTGFSIVSIVNITKIHIILFIMLFIAFLFSFFAQRKFLNTSFLLIVTGIFLIYFGPNMGMPLLTKQSRLAEYMFFAMTLLFSFYFLYFFYKPIFLVFKKFARPIVISICYIIFIISTLTLPKWINTASFWKNINEIEYTSIPELILQIDKENRPFTWTVVSYVQEYAKVRNKGYHVNTQNLLLRYNPQDKYLNIPTPKIYIFVENYPNPYRGMDEWFYRWRDKIEANLKSWIAIYSMNHNNIKIYSKTKTVTVYEIDNTKYINHLREEAKK